MPYNPYYQVPFNPYINSMTQLYQSQQPQGSTFIHVQSETQAREWNVTPGSSATFIDDNAPYCYTKSMGMSQFDAPVFKRFRLVEEDASQSVQKAQEQPSNVPEVNLSDYITKAEFEPFKAIIERVEKELFSNESVE